jgi:hypothetical protein
LRLELGEEQRERQKAAFASLIYHVTAQFFRRF